VSSSIVVIGPASALPSLRERLDSGAEMHTFTDTEAAEALAHIIRSKPRIVAVDHQFSATSGGTALINRIKDDPALLACELRVIEHDEPVTNATGGTASGDAAASDQPRPPLDHPLIRKARRYQLQRGVEVLVDGYTAGLINMSPIGAQVLSARALRPNQRVRLVFSDEKGIVRCHGSIVWASFEMPPGEPTRYRAGISFNAADPDALRAYLERHRLQN
jgi:hypothetical protein